MLLLSPLPPPSGGIATWTRVLLRESRKHPSISIRHIDLATRWKSILNSSLLLRIIGGSLQALRDTARTMLGLACFRPDIVHLTSVAGYSSVRDLIIMFLGRLFAGEAILHYRMSRIPTYRATRPWHYYAALLAMRAATQVIVLDGATLSCLRELFPFKTIWKLPNMVDLEAMDRLSTAAETPNEEDGHRSGIHLIFAGHLIPAKGIEELIDACTRLAGTELHLVGPVTEAYRIRLMQLARARDNGQWIHFHGALENQEVHRRMLESDIFLLPSHDEGFPNSLLEAMALGRPVVVTSVGAMAEIVGLAEESDCGICVEPRNARSLEAGLRKLLEHPDTWRLMGRSARMRVEKLYACAPVMRQLIHVWREAR